MIYYSNLILNKLLTYTIYSTILILTLNYIPIYTLPNNNIIFIFIILKVTFIFLDILSSKIL